MEKDYDEYSESWDQADEAPARDPLPPEPEAEDINASETRAMAREFDRAEAMPVREARAEAQPLEAAADVQAAPVREPQAKPVERAEPQSFSEAFRAARAEGKRVFMWNGKRYTTELKSEAKPAKRVARAPDERGLPGAQYAVPAAPAAPAAQPTMREKLAEKMQAVNILNKGAR